MKTALRICLGLLLAVSAVGCHTCQTNCQSGCDTGCNAGCDTGCGHKSCLSKLSGKFRRDKCDKCGCQAEYGGVEQEQVCECGHHHGPKKSKRKCDRPTEAAMYGYDKSVVYTGDDWQGIQQPAYGAMPGMMPMAGGCAGCAGGAPMMSAPSTGCAGCGGSGISPIPNGGGCASCGGTGNIQYSQPTPGGCASCGGNHPTPTSIPSAPPASGGCASCGAGSPTDSFYNPMAPGHMNPAPAPPAESVTPEGVPGNNAGGAGEPIQKINWVPRQL